MYADLIGRMRRAGVDALYYAGYPREIGLLRRQMAEAGFLPTTIIASAGSSEEYVMIAGPGAEGTLVVEDRAIDTAEFSRFAATFSGAYHVAPDVRSTRGYSSLMVWTQAAALAGTADGTAVAGAMRARTFHVLGVEVRFDGKGDVQGPLGEPALWIWHDRRLVPLQPGYGLGDAIRN